MKIKQYEHIQKEIESKDFIEPTETVYYFQTGIRRAIKIVPIFTTWQKQRFNKEEEVWVYKITCVYNCYAVKVETFSIKVSDLEDLYYNKREHSEFVKDWIDGDFQTRSQEQFNKDLLTVLSKITSDE